MKNRSTNQKKPRGTKQEVKQEPLISSLSEEQQIAMGFRNPRTITPNFAKTPEEKEKLKKVHSNAKVASNGGMPVKRRSEPELPLVINVIPNKSEGYKSTLAYKAKESEISNIINTFIGKDKVAKITYAGRVYEL